DQLPATLKQVEKAHRALRAVEAVLLLHRHPRHPAALGGQRIAGAGQLLLLDQQLLAGGIPLLRRYDRRSLHRCLSSLRYSSTMSNGRPHRRLRSIQSVASLSTAGSSESQWVRLRSYAAACRSPRAVRRPQPAPLVCPRARLTAAGPPTWPPSPPP